MHLSFCVGPPTENATISNPCLDPECGYSHCELLRAFAAAECVGDCRGPIGFGRSFQLRAGAGVGAILNHIECELRTTHHVEPFTGHGRGEGPLAGGDVPELEGLGVDQLAGRMLALFTGFQEERRTVGAVGLAPRDGEPVVYGFCSDGSVWVAEWVGDSGASHFRGWNRCPPIPGTRQAIEDLRSKRQRDVDLAVPSKLEGEG